MIPCINIGHFGSGITPVRGWNPTTDINPLPVSHWIPSFMFKTFGFQTPQLRRYDGGTPNNIPYKTTKQPMWKTRKHEDTTSTVMYIYQPIGYIWSKCSRYEIFTCIWLEFMVNVRELFQSHGACGWWFLLLVDYPRNFLGKSLICCCWRRPAWTWKIPKINHQLSHEKNPGLTFHWILVVE